MGSIRRVALVLGVSAVVAGGGGAGLVAYRSGDEAQPPAPTASASPTASPTASPGLPPEPEPRTPPQLAVDPAEGAPDAPAAVARALAARLSDDALGTRVNALVADAATGTVLYGSGADTAAIPASTTKVFTAAAALGTLGPDRRFETRVVAAGPVVRGVLDGDLVVVGGGDPTLSSEPVPSGYPRPATLASLARQVRKAGIRQVTGSLVVDASVFGGPTLAPGWKPTYVTEGSVAPIRGFMVDGGRVSVGDDERYRNPEVGGGLKMHVALRQAGVRVPEGVRVGPAPLTADEVAKVASPPVSALVERMLVRSDNELAEALARHVAVERGFSADFYGVTRGLDAAIADLGLDPPTLNDGSGLSRLNRVTPAQLVAVLTAAAKDERLRAVVSGLPVAAFTGTLAGRYDDPPSQAGAGYVRAKTGSLDNVATLAGVIHTRGGRTLVFAFTADRLPTRFVGAAARALDTAAAALARCGCA